MHTHITKSERIEISILLGKGYSARQIAKAMSRCHTSISREIGHHSINGQYIADKAHSKAKEKRRFSKYQGMKIEDRPGLHEYIIEKLKKYYTPEQIAGRIKYVDTHLPYISAKGIYKWLYSNYGQQYCHLLTKQRYQPKKYKKKKTKQQMIPNRIGIEKRSQKANNRSESGHFEEDTMMSGKRHKSTAALAVFCDRKTRYGKLMKIANLSPKTHVKAQKSMAEELQIKTITYDNGAENRYHEKLAHHLKIQTFFCNPYHSWEKGSVENMIGRIRRFIPKGSDIATLTDAQIAKIEHWLNHTPRKCLRFKTPYEIMSKNQKLSSNHESP